MTATIELHTHEVSDRPKCYKCGKEAMAIDIAFPNLRGGKSSETYFFCENCFKSIHNRITRFLNEENYELIVEKTEKLKALNEQLEVQVQKKKELKKKIRKQVRKIYDLLYDPPFIKLCEEAMETLNGYRVQ